jgi:hypothetical protein
MRERTYVICVFQDGNSVHFFYVALLTIVGLFTELGNWVVGLEYE